MPCFDPDADRLAAADARRHAQRLTRLLCDVCTWIDALNLDGVHTNGMPPEVRLWWRRHKRIDARRRRQEAREAKDTKDRLKALAKLTPRERALIHRDGVREGE